MYKIYALIDPRDMQIFYVGRTKQSAETRLRQHLEEENSHTLKQKRIKEIEDCSLCPGIVVLEPKIKDEKLAFIKEVFWIEQLQKVGADLTNASIDYGGTHFLTNNYDDSLENQQAIQDKDWQIKLPRKGCEPAKETDKVLGSQSGSVTQDSGLLEADWSKYADTIDQISSKLDDLTKTFSDHKQTNQIDHLEQKILEHQKLIQEFNLTIKDTNKVRFAANAKHSDGKTLISAFQSNHDAEFIEKVVNDLTGAIERRFKSLEKTLTHELELNFRKRFREELASTKNIFADENMFKIETIKSPIFIPPEAGSKKYSVIAIRRRNAELGRPLNHGLPFCEQEKAEMASMTKLGATDEEMRSYFQRPYGIIKKLMKLGDE